MLLENGVEVGDLDFDDGVMGGDNQFDGEEYGFE
jgi:hypothetical protein